MATPKELNDLLQRWIAAARDVSKKNTQAALDAAVQTEAAARAALESEIARAASTVETAKPLARAYEAAVADLANKRTLDKNFDDALANARAAYFAAVAVGG